MTSVRITSGDFRFTARLEEDLAPKTCALFRRWLPWRQKLIHVRWSGEGCWIPMGYDDPPAVPYENATSHPAPGHIIFHPGPAVGSPSEAEVLLAYGPVSFASKAGQLSGNHFLTITEGREHLADLGRLTLWSGAQDIAFELG